MEFLNGPFSVVLNRAFDVRKSVLGWELLCVFPGGSTLPLSLSGKECTQGCLHCNGHYLNSMTSIDTLLKHLEQNPEDVPDSVLISGGCLSDMRMPIVERAEDIRTLRRAGISTNFHVALPTSDDIDLILELADVVSLDFVSDPEVARRVFRTARASRGGFEDLYQRLQGRVRVVPHICIGLDNGRTGWEYQALSVLSELGVGTVTLNVIRPTAGTEFEKVSLPPLADVARIFAAARLLMPGAAIGIGCMRPGGAWRRKMDNLCLMAGADRIVSPLPVTLEFAQQMGLYVTPFDKCCAFPSI
jgi:hypothetical protein